MKRCHIYFQKHQYRPHSGDYYEDRKDKTPAGAFHICKAYFTQKGKWPSIWNANKKTYTNLEKAMQYVRKHMKHENLRRIQLGQEPYEYTYDFDVKDVRITDIEHWNKVFADAK